MQKNDTRAGGIIQGGALQERMNMLGNCSQGQEMSERFE
jgi:hypothetical protein